MNQKTSRSVFAIKPGKVGPTYAKLISSGTRSGLLPGIMSRHPEAISNKTELSELIANRLGWVDIATTMHGRIEDIESFGREALDEGLTQIVLIGMGGSSLCPEVFKLMFKRRAGVQSVDILDSTDPAAIKTVADKLDLQKSLFIVASKSGGTVETRSHEAFFIDKLKSAGIQNYGRHFAAITDPGSDLEKFALVHRYRQIFSNPSDIGGRYSALSFFGLVPGWFAGVDLEKLLATAIQFEEILRSRRDEANPALALGAFMAACATSGRDKLTFVASKRVSPFIPWIEQLIAESTGKQGKGVVPIEGEPKAPLAEYGSDRALVFIKFSTEKDASASRLQAQCANARVPHVSIELPDTHSLGGQFLLWEAATAACGAFLKINPFDEPNVTESKNNTQAILKAFHSSGNFPQQKPQKRWGKLSLVAVEAKGRVKDSDCATLDCVLSRLLKGERPPKYVSILSYVESSPATEKSLGKLRTAIRARTKLTTLRGYGPRFLHSIGQLYKGGPRTGIFIVLVHEQYEQLSVPNQYFAFGDLIRAQAIGDTQALVSRKLPVLVLGVTGNAAIAIAQLEQSLKKALLKK